MRTTVDRMIHNNVPHVVEGDLEFIHCKEDRIIQVFHMYILIRTFKYDKDGIIISTLKEVTLRLVA